MTQSLNINEADVWAALRLDMVEFTESPPSQAPVDRDFIRSLIKTAEERLERFVSKPLSEYDVLPADLAQALKIDVASYYFNRIDPGLPNGYWELIQPYRAWSFGRSHG